MGGGVPMAAVSSRLGMQWSPALAQEGALRLGDWCVKELGRPLQKGEVFSAQGLQIVVRKLRRHKLSEAFVRKSG
jgi:hypothetical protein